MSSKACSAVVIGLDALPVEVDISLGLSDKNTITMKNLQKHIIDEFSSDITEDRYLKAAEAGLWQSEEILIRKYFKAGSTILDVGCGTGRTTIPLHELGYKVLGVDITPRMIENAKKIAKANNLNIEYKIGDATKLEFPDDSFDGAIFANNGWAQIPGKDNRQKALNELRRVTKPGGILILTSHIRYYSLYYLYFWTIKWIKYFIFKPLGVDIGEIDYGDLFFRRIVKNKKLKQKQFIHLAGKGEVERQIKAAGFKLLRVSKMSEVSKSDARLMFGSLSPKHNSYKSPVFYICIKPDP